MSIPFYSARTIVEEKVQAYLATALTGVAVHKGITPETKVIPLVTVYAKSSRSADALGSNPYGNYTVTLEIGVYSSADDDTLDQHRTRVQTVQNYMADKTALKALWTLNTDGILYDLWVNQDEEGMHQRKYGNLLEYTVFVMLPPAP
jgi:hypothetical protein